LAGEHIPHYVDGCFLRPVLDGSVTSWRSAILLEAAANYSQAYRGMRTVSTNTISGRKYVEYAGGARELYNLESDGYELLRRRCVAHKLGHASASAKGLCRGHLPHGRGRAVAV
jgi:hypothetical protein